MGKLSAGMVAQDPWGRRLEMAGRLGALDALPEDPHSIPRTDMVAHRICSSSSRGFDALFDLLRPHTHGTQAYIQANTHVH